MKQVPLEEAGGSLSELIDLVLDGEEVVIARDGHPVARLSACEPLRALPAGADPRFFDEHGRPKPGGATGWIADDFDAPLDGEIGAAFRGDAS
jgi:antitoxin (DNA-binding transcriptional repressor) of toxin-antitoxin stability system